MAAATSVLDAGAVVPLVLGGTDEIFLGRRIVLRVLPPVTAASLLASPDHDATGDGEGARSVARSVPEPGGEGERATAHRVVAALETLVAPHVAECHRLVEPPPGTRRPFRRLTTLFH